MHRLLYARRHGQNASTEDRTSTMNTKETAMVDQLFRAQLLDRQVRVAEVQTLNCAGTCPINGEWSNLEPRRLMQQSPAGVNFVVYTRSAMCKPCPQLPSLCLLAF